METCKDCLHYDVCQYHIAEETDMTINECSYGFKNKADFVEVVRCKDCKYKKIMSDGKTLACIRQSAYKKPTDFCSYGERRTDNEKR